MIFPIGFGQWPKVFPFAIAVIAGVFLAWSLAFFPMVNDHNAKVKSLFSTQQESLAKSFDSARLAACQIRFPDRQDCQELISQINGSKSPERSLRTALYGQDWDSGVSTFEITAFLRALDARPETWPNDLKTTREFRALQSDLLRFRNDLIALNLSSGLTMRSNASLFKLMQATFTHLNYPHLIGNLLFLIVFGMWVEQRVGFLITFITFFAGSLTGIAIQLSVHPQAPCTGASAGVSALMGSFFIYFLRAEMRFLFTFAFIYYRKFWLPILWTFPLFFLATDIIAVLGQDNFDLVAHAAHLGGLIVGIGGGLFMNLALPLSKGALFYEEQRPLFVLSKSKDPEALWHAMMTLNEWNLQNWPALTLFLSRLQSAHIIYEDKDRNQILQKKMANYIEFIFRRGTVDEIIQVLQLVPTSLTLPPLIDLIPVSQVLYLADVTANRKIFELALPMYRLALTKVNDGHKKTLIRNTIHQIENMSIDEGIKQAK